SSPFGASHSFRRSRLTGRRSKRSSNPSASPPREVFLQARIEQYFENKPERYTEEHFALFNEFKSKLNAGEIRAAEPDPSSHTGWRVNVWVKKGILLGFRMGGIIDMSIDAARQPWLDKSTYPVRRVAPTDGVRIVPGGSSIRDGSYLGKGVTCMPPMY